MAGEGKRSKSGLWMIGADSTKPLSDRRTRKSRHPMSGCSSGKCNSRSSDDRRRELEPDVVARTERHGGRWIVIRDGRVVATPGKAGHVFRRELSAGGHQYWVAPPGTSRPRIP